MKYENVPHSKLYKCTLQYTLVGMVSPMTGSWRTALLSPTYANDPRCLYLNEATPSSSSLAGVCVTMSPLVLLSNVPRYAPYTG